GQIRRWLRGLAVSASMHLPGTSGSSVLSQPSGLGFREGAIVGLFALALPLPAGLATIMALLSRFVSTMAELLCVGIAYVSGGRQVRAIQQEQSIPAGATDTTAAAIIADPVTAEPSAVIPLEGRKVGE